MSIIVAGGEVINEVGLQVLRRSDLCRGLSAAEVQQIAAAVRPMRAASGDVICRQGEPGESMYLIVRGRVKAAVERSGESYRLLDYLGRGEHFGEMAVLTDGLRTATVSAVVDTELLELDREHFHRLLHGVPGFAANLSRSLGFRLRWETSRRKRPHRPTVVALINSTLRTQGVIRPLAEGLAEAHEAVHVMTDRPELWDTGGEYKLERAATGQAGDAKVRAVEERLHQVVEQNDRVLLDLTQSGLDHELPGLLASCEEIWWLVEPRFYATSCRNLRKLLAAEPRLAGRVHLLWVLDEGEPFAPPQPSDLGIAAPDFKIVLSPSQSAPGRQQRLGIQRLVRYLQGARLGIALGGGGARGMAHLGVLRALERAGIGFDLISGTSSGALMGVSYAGGWAPDEALASFQQWVSPPRWLRMTPGGFRLYLWSMFRMGGWDRKLRHFLGDARLEQLQIPLCTVAVDLVTGQQIVRDRGDAVHSVLESINVPTIARPILRDGMALVDGGVLNNLPADVLVERGASFVVGVDVAARLPVHYGRNKPGMETSQMRRAGILETLFRVNEVQAHGVTALRTGAVDFMITPDTSPFEFADFTRGDALADAGEAAAEAAIPQLRQMLADIRVRG